MTDLLFADTFSIVFRQVLQTQHANSDTTPHPEHSTDGTTDEPSRSSDPLSTQPEQQHVQDQTSNPEMVARSNPSTPANPFQRCTRSMTRRDEDATQGILRSSRNSSRSQENHVRFDQTTSQKSHSRNEWKGIDTILRHRRIRGEDLYLVRWTDFQATEWIPRENITEAALQLFYQTRKRRSSRN